jgi:hypothetical protein
MVGAQAPASKLCLVHRPLPNKLRHISATWTPGMFQSDRVERALEMTVNLTSGVGNTEMGSKPKTDASIAKKVYRFE